MHTSRLCFFTSDSTTKKDKFMLQLMYSFKEGGLTCSFNDFQLAEYIQQKRRHVGKLELTKAVKQVGLQENGTWVLGCRRTELGPGTKPILHPRW